MAPAAQPSKAASAARRRAPALRRTLPLAVALAHGWLAEGKEEPRPGFLAPTAGNGTELQSAGVSSAPLHTFYLYRAVSDEIYPPENINAGNLAGVLWYVHHEVVIQYPRKFQISRIVRYKVQTRATDALWKLGMNFGPRAAFDKGQCTGPFLCGKETSGVDVMPKFCDVASAESGPIEGGPIEWKRFGYVVGCNRLGDWPFPTFPVYYPDAAWFSLPGRCPSKPFNAKTKECAAQEPGGLCKGPPTGAPDCTWSYEVMGSITLDELVGKSAAQLNSEQGREYDPDFDKGNRFTWWDGLNSASRNLQRLNETRMLFARKYPKQVRDEDMSAPPCDFNMGHFYHDYYGKDPHSGPCQTAKPGSPCYTGVLWAMQEGIHAHPEWYPDLTPASSFKDFQRAIYVQGKEECPRRPCEAGEKEPVDRVPP